MSPLALTRTALQRQGARQIRHYATTKAVPARAAADWGSQWKKVGGSAMMYFPVVAVVMFWPYAVMPVMEKVEERW